MSERRFFVGSVVGWKRMHKTLVVIALALALAGCANGRQDRVLGGALIGGGTGPLSVGWPGARRVPLLLAV